jgi:hypothetical protein
MLIHRAAEVIEARCCRHDEADIHRFVVKSISTSALATIPASISLRSRAMVRRPLPHTLRERTAAVWPHFGLTDDGFLQEAFMKIISQVAVAVTLLIHTDALVMVRDASINHDLGGVREQFKAMLRSHEGQATDRANAVAAVRDAEVPR